MMHITLHTSTMYAYLSVLTSQTKYIFLGLASLGGRPTKYTYKGIVTLTQTPLLITEVSRKAYV